MVNPNTLRGYESDLRQIIEWWGPNWWDMESADLVRFIEWQRTRRSVGTIDRQVASLTHHFSERYPGTPAPTYAKTVRTALQELRARPHTPDRPYLLDYSQMMDAIEAMPTSQDGWQGVRALRDTAILLVGWWGCLERGVLTGLQHNHVRPRKGDVWEVVMRSDHRQANGPAKTKRDRRLDVIPAVENWKDAANIDSGYLFRGINGEVYETRMSPRVVTRAVKQAVERIGLDPKRYSSNTLYYGPADAR